METNESNTRSTTLKLKRTKMNESELSCESDCDRVKSRKGGEGEEDRGWKSGRTRWRT